METDTATYFRTPFRDIADNITPCSRVRGTKVTKDEAKTSSTRRKMPFSSMYEPIGNRISFQDQHFVDKNQTALDSFFLCVPRRHGRKLHWPPSTSDLSIPWIRPKICQNNHIMNQQLSTPSPNLRQDPNNKTYQSRKRVFLDEEDEIPDFLPCDEKYSIDNIYKDLILPQSVVGVDDDFILCHPRTLMDVSN
uniref:Uncharacterized protein n=1 Tax=Ditylum brightwellii TaxID=49249 RepID=A0A7S4QPB7_9STRA